MKKTTDEQMYVICWKHSHMGAIHRGSMSFTASDADRQVARLEEHYPSHLYEHWKERDDRRVLTKGSATESSVALLTLRRKGAET